MKMIVAILLLASSTYFAQLKMDEGWKEAFQGAFIDGINKNIHELEKEAFDNRLEKLNLKFGLELLRTDDKNQEIILRKNEYPIPDIKNDLFQSKLVNDVNINMYAGLIEIPITTMDLTKEFISTLSDKQMESIYTYGLIVIPIKRDGNEYTLRLSFLTAVKILGINSIISFREQNINMRIGEKIKIDIDPSKIGQHVKIDSQENPSLHGMYGYANAFSSDSSGNWTIFPTINGQVVKFSSHDDFFKDKKDYLILSFESDK